MSSFVAPHVGRRVVLKMDLRDFFPSITAARVLAVFMTAGYPEDVARLLAGLCTNTVPREVMRAMEQASPARGPEAWRSRRLFDEPHLPQGAPTSPALANLCAYRLDVRLRGLAEAAGADYTRYADDLVFSGDDEFARSVRSFHIRVAAIALEEGFAVQHHKTRAMRQGVRQKAAGVVLNRHPNVPREDFDRLKATLHNCLKHGPAGQDRAGLPDFRAHLMGRIAHVAALNPARGERLKADVRPDRVVRLPGEPSYGLGDPGAGPRRRSGPRPGRRGQGQPIPAVRGSPGAGTLRRRVHCRPRADRRPG